MAKQITLEKKDLKLIKKYINLLKKKGIKVSQIILFGSHAKGNAKPDSDIDIAVISSKFGRNSLKADIVLHEGLTLVTQNEEDFKHAGISLANP